ncbi:hypothetical protein ES332_A01G068300v1 [Gossypium tomentosum]|uniref:TF-B3 domain-containing protein n=1 Tax=Gossypium tomentosum TaxID=34277 RepID=A0A5D2RMH6_GOSTO|nr:hypothetical protein ES332_A01G068300v1 [Gossypium tomentosum]
MPSFEKYLTEVAVNKHLAIPSEFLQHLPDSEGGRTITFPVHDVSGKVWKNFGYYIRKGGGYPKPVFQNDWRRYVQDKRLKPGDKIIFRVERNEDNGAPIYTIAAQKKIELFGSFCWSSEF